MNRRQLKKKVLEVLQIHDFSLLYSHFKEIPPKSLLNPLFIALCNPSERVRWNAVRCFGKAVSAIADEDFESARIVMRRFLWMLNDESGGIGWGAPESMAEVMFLSENLFEEYSHMLISYMREDGEELHQDGNYLELPLLQRGLLWGVARLCDKYPEEMIQKKVTPDLIKYLSSGDDNVACMAFFCLIKLGVNPGEDLIKGMQGRSVTCSIYEDGSFTQYSTKDLVGHYYIGD
jgi:hypothetical protein